MLYLTKVVNILIHPLSWVVVLLLVALVRGQGKGGKGSRPWTVSAVVLLLFLGWDLPANWAMRQLEDSVPPLQSFPSDVQGVVVLGGGTDRGRMHGVSVLPSAVLPTLAEASRPSVQPGKSIARQMPAGVPLNDAAERLIEPIIGARRHPDWIILFTGGLARQFSSSPAQPLSEAELAHILWTELELENPIRIEMQSTNTRENAALSARLGGIDKTQRWLLVTSSWHMPRALRIFQSEGWNVVPWPVDYRYDPHVEWTDYSFARSLQLWQIVLHEWVGLIREQIG